MLCGECLQGAGAGHPAQQAEGIARRGQRGETEVRTGPPGSHRQASALPQRLCDSLHGVSLELELLHGYLYPAPTNARCSGQTWRRPASERENPSDGTGHGPHLNVLIRAGCGLGGPCHEALDHLLPPPSFTGSALPKGKEGVAGVIPSNLTPPAGWF